jgi:hypothetical protein
MFARSVSLERLQAISRRRLEVLKTNRRVDHRQLVFRAADKVRRKAFGAPASRDRSPLKRFDHVSDVSFIDTNVKRSVSHDDT